MIYQGDAFKYILQTPQILSDIMSRQQSIFLESCDALAGKKMTELYLTGSGSSYNSAVSAAGFLQRILGIRVFTVYPADFMEEMEAINPDAVLIGISQQGTSVAVIEAMDKMRQSGRFAISVTGEYDTEITRHGDANIYIECGYEDAGATTKGYTASVLTLILFGLKLARQRGTLTNEEYESYQIRIKKIIDNMEPVLIQSREWCEKQVNSLLICSNLIVIAGGNLKPLLLEAVLKFSETCRFPVRGYGAEEFMHGMYNAVDRHTEFLYLFPSGGYELQRMQKLYHYYEHQGNKQYVLNFNPVKGLTGCFVNDKDFSVLEFALPLQMLFVLTSRGKGIDLNVPKDPDFHKYMKSKIEE